MDFHYWITLLSSLFSPLLASNVAHQCAQVLNIDCLNSYKPEGNEAVCASDMIVYKNLCFFAQEKCRHPSLAVLYPGTCLASITNTPDPPPTVTSAPPPTTQAPATNTPANSDLIYSVFCENVAKFDCADELNPVCGTDNAFYKNDCELAKAKCTNPNLKSQDLSICKAAQQRRRKLGSDTVL